MTSSSINLGGGNTQTFSGSFTRVGGAAGDAGTAQLAGSLLLAANNFYRQFTDDPALTIAAQNLPQMQGSGAVRDLRPAMSLGTAQANAAYGGDGICIRPVFLKRRRIMKKGIDFANRGGRFGVRHAYIQE